MNSSKVFAATLALVACFAAAPAASAAPLDSRFAGLGDFESIAQGSTGEMRVFGDPATQAAALSLVWPQGAVSSFTGGALDRPARGMSGDPGARNGFERMLASEAGGLGFSADPRMRGNPYLALGTWGGDGRAILHNIALSDSGHGGGASLFAFDTGRAIEVGFDGFVGRGGGRAEDGDPPCAFDCKPMFNPSGFPSPLASSGGPGSGGGDPGSGGGSGSGGGGGPGPTPVPEPGMIGILILGFAATLTLRFRWSGFALDALRRRNRRRGIALIAALAFLPGLAFAASGEADGMRDWERLCNGAGGAPPELIAEGCSAVIGSGDESLGNVAIAYNNRGNALRAQEKYEAAARDYDNAIMLAPADPFPYRNRGLVRGLMGQYELALVDFNQAIRLKSDYASAFLGRGFAHEQLGQPDQAAADFAKAAKLDPKLAAIIPAP